MSDEEVVDRVRKVIIDQLEPKVDVTLQSTVASDLGADSLARVELVMAMEEEFEIEIKDEELDSSEDITVQQIVDLVKGKLDEKQA